MDYGVAHCETVLQFRPAVIAVFPISGVLLYFVPRLCVFMGSMPSYKPGFKDSVANRMNLLNFLYTGSPTDGLFSSI